MDETEVKGYQEDRVEVYTYYPRKLAGTIHRLNLRDLGLAAHSPRISATKMQLEIFSQQPTWEPAP